MIMLAILAIIDLIDIGATDIGGIVDGDYPCYVRPQVISPAGITKVANASGSGMRMVR
jgi:hypothetical protein